MVQINFQATQYDPSTGGTDVFETGEYNFHIVSSEVKSTKDNSGTMLIFTAECLDPENARKRLVIRLNVQNPSAQAVEIAYRDLSAICHVCGVLQIADTQQLHGRPFRIRLEKSPRRDDPTKFGNEIRGYLDVNGNPPARGIPGGGNTAPAAPAPAAVAQPVAQPAPAPAPVAPAAPAPAPAATPPWSAPAAAATVAGSTPPWQTS